MTKEEKDLLLRDLCDRLPYGVFLKIGEYSDYTLQGIVHSNANKPLIVRCNGSDFECSIDVVKPYLRPMDSMTEEEVAEFESITEDLLEHGTSEEIWDTVIDWLNAHHFDHRHLIEKGLALEAPEGMYKTE